MSHYRLAVQEVWAENDVRVLNRRHSLGQNWKVSTIAANQPALPPSAAVDWTLTRKARPLDFLLPMTRRWIDAIPIGARPVSLPIAYPRIANRLAAAWLDDAECRMVFDDLLIDRRGGRQGFPPAVLRELLALREQRFGGHTARQ